MQEARTGDRDVKKKPAKKTEVHPDKALKELCDGIVRDIYAEVEKVYIRRIGELSDRLTSAESTSSALRAIVDDLSSRLISIEEKKPRRLWWLGW